MEIDNRIIAGVVIFWMLLVAVAIRDGEIASGAGYNITMNSTGGYVIIEKNLSVDDDIILADDLYLTGDIRNTLDITVNPRTGTSTLARYVFGGSVTGSTQMNLYNDAGKNAFIAMFNATNSYSNGLEFRNTNGDITVRPNTAFKPRTDNTYSSGTASYRWSDTRSVLINGADICFDNGICFVECVIDNKKDICFVAQKPTPDMVKSIALGIFDTYQDYVEAHSLEGVFDNSMGESEYNTRRSQIIIDGKRDYLLGRTSYGSLRQIRDYIINHHSRLAAIENTLCQEGHTEYC